MLWKSAGVLISALPSQIPSSFHPYVVERVLGLKYPRPSHCYSAHFIWWGHHLGCCLCLNFSLALPGSLVMNGWHGEEGAISTSSMMIHCQVCVPTLVCDDIFGVLVIKDWQVDLPMASWFLIGMLAMAWMPWSSWPLRPWWHWWWSWCCAPINLESMVWWKWEWPGWSHP